MSEIIQMSQLVSVNVPVAQLGQQRFNFPDQPQLRSIMKGQNVVIDGIETFCNEDITVDPFGQAVITPAVMKTAFVTLFISNGTDPKNMAEYVNFMPLTSIHRVQAQTSGNVTAPFVRNLVKFPGLTVDWSKSYVTVGTAIGGSTSYTFLFNIYYHFGAKLE